MSIVYRLDNIVFTPGSPYTPGSPAFVNVSSTSVFVDGYIDPLLCISYFGTNDDDVGSTDPGGSDNALFKYRIIFGFDRILDSDHPVGSPTDTWITTYLSVNPSPPVSFIDFEMDDIDVSGGISVVNSGTGGGIVAGGGTFTNTHASIGMQVTASLAMPFWTSRVLCTER